METTNLKHVRICYSNNNHPVQYRYEDNGFDFVGWSVRLVRPNHSMWKCGVEEQVNDRKRLVSTSASLYVNVNKNLRHQKHQKENDSKRPSKTNTTDPKQPHHSRLHNHFSWRRQPLLGGWSLCILPTRSHLRWRPLPDPQHLWRRSHLLRHQTLHL